MLAWSISSLVKRARVVKSFWRSALVYRDAHAHPRYRKDAPESDGIMDMIALHHSDWPHDETKD